MFFFFVNDPATTEIYTLSLHDALPIPPSDKYDALPPSPLSDRCQVRSPVNGWHPVPPRRDRKSTRLNSSHVKISYAVFCLKKKKRSSYQNATKEMMPRMLMNAVAAMQS